MSTKIQGPEKMDSGNGKDERQAMPEPELALGEMDYLRLKAARLELQVCNQEMRELQHMAQKVQGKMQGAQQKLAGIDKELQEKLELRVPVSLYALDDEKQSLILQMPMGGMPGGHVGKIQMPPAASASSPAEPAEESAEEG